MGHGEFLRVTDFPERPSVRWIEKNRVVSEPLVTSRFRRDLPFAAPFTLKHNLGGRFVLCCRHRHCAYVSRRPRAGMVTQR